MSVKTKITCGQGHGYAVGVTPDHALKVSTLPARLNDLGHALLTAQKVYREYFSDAIGSRVMNASGGTVFSPLTFMIRSKSDRTLVINDIRIFLNSTLMAINTTEIRRFGAAAAAPGLPNGISLNAIQGGIVTPIFLDPVQTIGDFLYWTESYTNFIDAVEAGVDLLTFTISLEVPVILPAGSPDRLEFQIRDNLAPLALFRAIVHGSQELA